MAGGPTEAPPPPAAKDAGAGPPSGKAAAKAEAPSGKAAAQGTGAEPPSSKAAAEAEAPSGKAAAKADGLVMGFDFGLTRIGVAVGQRITRTASPVGVVTAKGGEPVWVELDALLKEWAPGALVVGLPLNMDSTMSEMAGRAARFGEQLASRYCLPVEMMDERLSSFEAKSLAPDAAAPLDALAASLILETWLATK